MFIPELFNKEETRYFSFRIADDGKNLKFFSDLKKRGMDILSGVKTVTEPKCEKIVHTINPAYLDGSNIKDFTLTIIYDIREDFSIPEDDLSIERKISPKPEEQKDEQPDTVAAAPAAVSPEIEASLEDLPYLESAMTLLPEPKKPKPGKDDIPSYILTIGDEKKSIKFYASIIDKEVSIGDPVSEEEVYKRAIDDAIDYTIKLGSISYSFSNAFISRIDEKDLKRYFSWELNSNVEKRINLEADFYIFGRDPLEDLTGQGKKNLEAQGQLLRLNKSSDDFWRIGASRNHALLMRDVEEYTLYNISCSYHIYIIKESEQDASIIKTSKLTLVPEEKEREIKTVLSGIAVGPAEDYPGLWQTLEECADSTSLESNDLVIIGSKVYRFVIPYVMESQLSDRARQSILRTIEANKSILRSY